MDGSGGPLEPGESEDGTGTLLSKFLALENDMATKLGAIQYDERVRVVYNPLDYARQTHEFFVRAALSSGRPKVVFLGMNPGPHGMSQNGVPFGDTVPVRDWLCIRGEVHKPYPEHPKRPVDGLQCSKTEVSGKRFWGLMKELCGGDANRFLQSCFVHNFCPLSFMMDNGRNITPDQLRGEGKKKLHEVCDESLRDVLGLLRPELVVGIGKYATERAQTAVSRLESAGGMRVEGIAHPSPASPEANQGWHKLAMHQLNGAGLLQLVGWSVSEELLREAAEEAQRITA
ncbi:single-strand selective monofunctional uracil DNA glycosylase-like, partial [Tropilaelaps mercedesae]